MSTQTSDTEPVLIVQDDNEVVVHSHDDDLLLTIAWEAENFVPPFLIIRSCMYDVVYKKELSMCVVLFMRTEWVQKFATRAAGIAMDAGHRVELDLHGGGGENGQKLIKEILALRKN